MRAENEKQMFAFVIMPFDPEFDRIYEDLIVPALESAGYEVGRADSVIDQQNIVKDIVHGIDHADLIVAELTTLNPNVLYELGIAHGLVKPTVMLTQSIEDVPFDLRPYKIIPYSTHYAEVPKLHDHLYEIAHKLKEGSISFGNPVSDFAPSIQDREKIERYPKPIEAAPMEIITEEDELGIPDFLVELKNSSQGFSKHFGRANKMTDRLNEKMRGRMAEIESTMGGDPGSTARVYKIVKAMASDMIQYAEKVEGEMPRLYDSWERVEQSSTNFFSIVSIESAEDRDSMITLTSVMEEFQEIASGGIGDARRAQEGISKLKGLNRDLDRAVQRTIRAIDEIRGLFALAESFAARMINLISERLEAEGD